jgi:protein-disulfide isomerase
MMMKLAAVLLAFALPAMAETAVPTPEAAPAAAPVITDMAMGPADAKVTIIEYASFTCPHCAAFHETVFKPLKADYIDTGKVRFEYREFYRNKYDLWAGMMARCGGEMRYFGINDILMSTQMEWAGSDDPTVVVDNLKRIGRSTGMDDATLEACMNDEAMAKAMVEHFQTNSVADDVQGTPTVFINGVNHSGLDYAGYKAIIDPLLVE